MVTGSSLYRLQYSDELQVPQAEVDFEELVSFLLDRGAVPDVKGLHMLRLAGIWTPVRTVLLLSPDTTRTALRIALSNHSDGVLNLALHGEKAWDNRDDHFLPPDWMRLRSPEESKEQLGKGMPEEDENATIRKAQHGAVALVNTLRKDQRSSTGLCRCVFGLATLGLPSQSPTQYGSTKTCPWPSRLPWTTFDLSLRRCGPHQ